MLLRLSDVHCGSRFTFVLNFHNKLKYKNAQSVLRRLLVYCLYHSHCVQGCYWKMFTLLYLLLNTNRIPILRIIRLGTRNGMLYGVKNLFKHQQPTKWYCEWKWNWSSLKWSIDVLTLICQGRCSRMRIILLYCIQFGLPQFSRDELGQT